MRGVFTVWAKECLENLRDRRTVMTALLLGPLFGPLLFAGMLRFSLDHNRRGFDESFELAVVNSAAASNLMMALSSGGVTVRDLPGGEAQARQAIATRTAKVVLEIPEDFGARLAEGRPAPLRLYSDGSRNGDARYVARVRLLIVAWSQRIASARLTLRGVDPTLLSAIALQDVDVSTPAGRSLLVLGMLSFFLILSLMTGGVYLAIDTTVGERERGTLEPLLATPVPRTSLLAGKMLATGSYMLLSMSITAFALFTVLSRLDLEQYGMSANLGPRSALIAIGITMPLVPLLTGLMTLVAAIARSLREAQAWLGILQLLPTVPLVFAGLMNLAPNLRWMAVPSLSQHLLITQLLRGEGVDLGGFAVSAGVTLLLGVLAVWTVARLYRRESLLG
jgi:sodium transport system permease protein